jgi:formylglycine-generating enzyme required for sulfatase activity
MKLILKPVEKYLLNGEDGRAGVGRGGSWFNYSVWLVSVSNRDDWYEYPSHRAIELGFRLVRNK